MTRTHKHTHRDVSGAIVQSGQQINRCRYSTRSAALLDNHRARHSSLLVIVKFARWRCATSPPTTDTMSMALDHRDRCIGGGAPATDRIDYFKRVATLSNAHILIFTIRHPAALSGYTIIAIAPVLASTFRQNTLRSAQPPPLL